MQYLIDTHWIVSFLNGRPDADTLFHAISRYGLAISTISWGEICEGLLQRPAPQHHLKQFEDFVESFDVLAPDVNIALQYAHVRLLLRSQGQLIPDNDIWIAATALAHDLTLLSRDRHFARIPQLKLHTEG